MKYNPKRTGKVTWEDSKTKMTDEKRKELSERFKKVQKFRKTQNVQK